MPTEEELLAELYETAESYADALDFERRYGPTTDDPSVEAEFSGKDKRVSVHD